MYNKDKWLTNQFGYNVFKISEFNSKDLVQIDKKNNKSFTYFKTTNYIKNKVKLNKCNFNLIEKTILFYLKISKRYYFQDNCRIAKKKDKNEIKEISKYSFLNSRFFQDTKIQKKIAYDVKKNWIESYFLGKRGNNILVYETKKIIHGFILLIYRKNELIVDLIAVKKGSRGKEIGSKLIESSISLYKDLRYIYAGTQESNISSISFYKKNNFKIKRKGYTFHRHKP